MSVMSRRDVERLRFSLGILSEGLPIEHPIHAALSLADTALHYMPRESKWDESHKNMNGEPMCRTCGEYGYHDWCARPTPTPAEGGEASGARP